MPLLLPTPAQGRTLGSSRRFDRAFRAAVERLSSWEAPLPAGESVRVHPGLVLFRRASWGEHHTVDIHQAGNGLDAVWIGAADDRGLRYGLCTLAQILRQYPGEVPCLSIADRPAFATRGVMLDVSRDKVPTVAQLERTVDLLASLKFNHLQLYTEHTFAYAGHDGAWEGSSALTPSEVRSLDAYCAARGIELAPNQNCFGHLAHWLRLPRYAPLAEIEGDAPWKFLQFDRRGPFSLCPADPACEAFVADLLGQLLPCFASGLVNIGCDETFDVGWGRSRPLVERRAAEIAGGEPTDAARSTARAELYFDFVAKIARVCGRHGRRPMMWADIALSHPELLGRMPAGAVGLAWWYEPTEKFEPWVRVLREHGHAAWVCPGTSSWRSFTGRTAERRANIADAAEQGLRAGAEGFLVCDWGDVGHRQQWPVSLAGIAQAAEAAWNPARARAFDPRATSLHVLGDPSMTLGPWLDELGDADLEIRRAVGLTNATALFNDLHPPVPEMLKAGERQIKAGIGQWEVAAARLARLTAECPAIGDPLVRDEVHHTLEVAAFAVDHAIAVRDPARLARERGRLIERCGAILEDHERLWLARNRPGGLAHASGFYRKVIDDLRGARAV